MALKDIARAELLKLLKFDPVKNPEPPLAIECASSVSVRTLKVDGRGSTLEMRHKLLPLLKHAAGTSLEMGRPLHWLPRDLWNVFWEFKDERWEAHHNVTQSIYEAKKLDEALKAGDLPTSAELAAEIEKLGFTDPQLEFVERMATAIMNAAALASDHADAAEEKLEKLEAEHAKNIELMKRSEAALAEAERRLRESATMWSTLNGPPQEA